MTTKLKVTGMTCGHCKSAVEGAVREVPGVEAATVDLESGSVTVEHAESVSVESLSRAVASAGYEMVGVGSQ